MENIQTKNKKLTPNLSNKIKTRLKTEHSAIEISKTFNISKYFYYKTLRLIAPPTKSTDEAKFKANNYDLS